MTTVMRHLRSTFSLGVGYERTPAGRRFEADAVRGYYIDFTAKTRSPSALSPEKLSPAALAQLALGWWERYLAGETKAERVFADLAALLEQRASVEDGARLWRYDVAVPKYGLEPGWISALAQGQSASVFLRSYLLSGDERAAALAEAAVVPLLQQEPPSLIAEVGDGVGLEECPTIPPSLILNGWIYAAWGLRDVAIGLGSADALAMHDETIACLVKTLPRYDAGWWSRYSLFPHRVSDLAKTFYHRLHVDQLEAMGALTGQEGFTRLAERWRSYDRASRRAALTVHKAAFVLSRYR